MQPLRERLMGGGGGAGVMVTCSGSLIVCDMAWVAEGKTSGGCCLESSIHRPRVFARVPVPRARVHLGRRHGGGSQAAEAHAAARGWDPEVGSHVRC